MLNHRENNLNRSLWIGLTDLEEEGYFKGPDGSEITFTYWDTGIPDNTVSSQGQKAIKESRIQTKLKKM